LSCDDCPRPRLVRVTMARLGNSQPSGAVGLALLFSLDFAWFATVRAQTGREESPSTCHTRSPPLAPLPLRRSKHCYRRSQSMIHFARLPHRADRRSIQNSNHVRDLEVSSSLAADLVHLSCTVLRVSTAPQLAPPTVSSVTAELPLAASI
jgi:hypothetical protein